MWTNSKQPLVTQMGFVVTLTLFQTPAWPLSSYLSKGEHLSPSKPVLTSVRQERRVMTVLSTSQGRSEDQLR